jgi:predicted RNA-binding Zn ribbon-like protein
MLTAARPGPEFKFLGGALCLDFSNTIGGRYSAEPNERLTSPNRLVEWGLAAGTLTTARADALQQVVTRHPKRAAKVLRRAVAFREAIYRVFSEIVKGAESSTEGLEVLNAELADSYSRMRMLRTPAGIEIGWPYAGDRLEQVLWPVSRSVAELLTSDETLRVRECAGPEPCGFLFLNPTGRRRWCSMTDCGNRAKARRHYARVRSSV